MLYGAIGQIKQSPKKNIAPVKSTQSPANFDSLASKIIENLLIKLPPQELKASLSIEHDAKHWEGLIDKLKELTITPPNIHVSPNVNVEATDNSAIVEAVQNLSKLVRSLNQKRCITLNVLRDEDGKMAQIVIEE